MATDTWTNTGNLDSDDCSFQARGTSKFSRTILSYEKEASGNMQAFSASEVGDAYGSHVGLLSAPLLLQSPVAWSCHAAPACPCSAGAICRPRHSPGAGLIPWIHFSDLCHKSQKNQIYIHENRRILEMSAINPRCCLLGFIKLGEGSFKRSLGGF